MPPGVPGYSRIPLLRKELRGNAVGVRDYWLQTIRARQQKTLLSGSSRMYLYACNKEMAQIARRLGVPRFSRSRADKCILRIVVKLACGGRESTGGESACGVRRVVWPLAGLPRLAAGDIKYYSTPPPSPGQPPALPPFTPRKHVKSPTHSVSALENSLSLASKPLRLSHKGAANPPARTATCTLWDPLYTRNHFSDRQLWYMYSRQLHAFRLDPPPPKLQSFRSTRNPSTSYHSTNG